MIRISGLFFGGAGSGGRAAEAAGSGAPSGVSKGEPSVDKISAALCGLLGGANSPFEPVAADFSDRIPVQLLKKQSLPEAPDTFPGRFSPVADELRRFSKAFLFHELPWLRLDPSGYSNDNQMDFGPASFFATLVLYDAVSLSRARLDLEGLSASSRLDALNLIRVNVKNHLERLDASMGLLRPMDPPLLFVLSRQAGAFMDAFDFRYAGKTQGTLSPLGQAAARRLEELDGKRRRPPAPGSIEEAGERLESIREKIRAIRNSFLFPSVSDLERFLPPVFESEAASALLSRSLLEIEGEMSRLSKEIISWVFKYLDVAVMKAKGSEQNPEAASKALAGLRFLAFTLAGFFRRCLEDDVRPGSLPLGALLSPEALEKCSGILAHELGWAGQMRIGGIDSMHEKTGMLLACAKNYLNTL